MEKVNKNFIFHKSTKKDIEIKKTIEAFFEYLKLDKKDTRTPQDIINWDEKLYKKIRRYEWFRDEIHKKVNREIIELFGQQTFPESRFLSNEIKLQKDFQWFLQWQLDKQKHHRAPTILVNEYQGLYKRIKSEGKYKKNGLINWSIIHNELWWELAAKISVQYEEHTIYDEKYVREKFDTFFKELITRWDKTWNPKQLEIFDSWLYSHLVKSYKTDKKRFDRRQQFQEMYWNKWLTLKHQTYTDKYITEMLSILYKQLRDVWREKCHPQDIHLYDLQLFRSLWQKKFRGNDWRIDREKVSKAYRPYEDIKLERNDRIFTTELEKRLFQDFFYQNKNRYRSPNKLKKFDEWLYWRLSRTYKHNGSIDRFYILVHIVKDPDKILLFRHKHNHEFSKKNLNKVINQGNIELEKIEYRLSSSDLNPEEAMIYNEQRTILQNAIVKLSKEEKDIIKKFYNEEIVDIWKLNSIIDKLRSMV